MNIVDNYLLEKQLRIVAQSFLQNADLSKRRTIIFRCNICGDSSRNKNKKRGYFILRENRKLGGETWQFFCFNCNASMLAEIYLKNYFPLNYKQYIRDSLSIKDFSLNEKIEEECKEQLKKESEIKKIKELEDVKCFIPILEGKGKVFEDAINYCNSRLIDKEIWSKWYVGIDRKYKNRLIIPFLNDNNEIYYWQGRALYDNMFPKYLNRVDNRDQAIFNVYNINKKDPVLVLEGPIDSLFVKNSIATLGTKIPEKIEEELNKLNCFYIFDNDKDGKNKSLKYLLQNKYVFNWDLFLKDNFVFKKIKDINDLILYDDKFKEMMNFECLKKYFTNNVFDKFYFV